MSEVFYAPTLSNTIGYFQISPQGYSKELKIEDGYVWDGWKHYKIGVEAFPDVSQVKEKAEGLRLRRIKSLEKQIQKLSSVSFV